MTTSSPQAATHKRPVWFARRPGRGGVRPVTFEGRVITGVFVAGMVLWAGTGGLIAAVGRPIGWWVMGLGMLASGAWFIRTALRHGDDSRWN